MRDNASQMIYCNFTKNRTADEIVRSFTDTWKLNPGWNIYDPSKPDVVNTRYIRMDPLINLTLFSPSYARRDTRTSALLRVTSMQEALLNAWLAL